MTPAPRLAVVTGVGRRRSIGSGLVRFLFSPAGSWINGQILSSNGGFKAG